MTGQGPAAPLVVAQGWIGGYQPAGRAELPPMFDLAELAEAAAHFGPRVTVFVVDWANAQTLTKPRRAAWVQDGWAIECTSGEDGPRWRWELRHDDTGRHVTVVDLPADAGQAAGPFAGLGAGELLAVLAAWHEHTGAPWAAGVGRSAEQLILSTHPLRRGGRRLAPLLELPEELRANTLEQPWANWTRPLTTAEQGAGYRHTYDVNAQYLASWGGAQLGHGEPEWRPGAAYHGPGTAAFYKVQPPDHDAMGTYPLPEPVPVPWLAGQTWWATPTMARAIEWADELGFELPPVLGAYVWPESTRYLRPAYERLRDTRDGAAAARAGALETVADIAEDDEPAAQQAAALLGRVITSDTLAAMVKHVYAVQTGRFGMGARDPRSPWARPDWANTIRAHARANLHRRIAGLGAAPVAIRVDELDFATDTADPLEFARAIGLPIGRGLGQFKVKLSRNRD